MIHRIYDTFGIVDNTPGYVYIYADERVATRAPSDPDIYQIILDALEAKSDQLMLSPELTLELLKPKLDDYMMTNIAITAPEHIYDRYLMPRLLRDDMRVVVFARP